MKKSKLSLCLASSFVAALSLVACSGDVSGKDGAVVTVTDANGNVVDILTDAAYNEYKTDSNGVSKFYNAILETLIRYEYANPASKIRTQNWTKAIKSNADIKSEAENNVKNDKNTAEENAKTNDTSYEEEWGNILSSHNCDDESELLEYYIYQLEKEDLTDKFFLQQKDSTLLTEWIGVKDDGSDPQGSAKAVFPYHIRHVLTSISGGSSDFYNGTITSAEANNLKNTVAALADAANYKTFADVAKKYSGDSGSGAKGGDVGVMATTTSFVNEFKLGVYAFDAMYNQGHAANTTINNGLGITEEVSENWGATGINNGKIQEVPFGAFMKIGDLANEEKDSEGAQVNKGNEHYFPRNVLYNFYLNYHNPFVITKQSLNNTDGWVSDDFSEYEAKYGARFEDRSSEIGVTSPVLVDENHNIIIGVRSEHGIHYMIMQKSIYDFSEGGNGNNNTSLEDYYTSLTPNDPNFPHKADGTKKDVYVNYIQTTDNTVYTSRSSDIKTAVQSFDATYDYRLFNYILGIEGTNVSIKDETLAKSIEEYISRTRENNNYNAYKTLDDAWRSYTELVNLQYESRTNDWKSTDETLKDRADDANRLTAFRTIHPRCAIGFKEHSGDAWEKVSSDGSKGICYYED